MMAIIVTESVGPISQFLQSKRSLSYIIKNLVRWLASIRKLIIGNQHVAR